MKCIPHTHQFFGQLILKQMFPKAACTVVRRKILHTRCTPSCIHHSPVLSLPFPLQGAAAEVAFLSTSPATAAHALLPLSSTPSAIAVPSFPGHCSINPPLTHTPSPPSNAYAMSQNWQSYPRLYSMLVLAYNNSLDPGNLFSLVCSSRWLTKPILNL